MKTTHLLKSVAAAVVLVGASLSASANTTSTLVLDDIGLTTFYGGSTRGPFTDIIEFVLPDTSASTFSLVSTPFFDYLKSTLTGFALFSNQDGSLYNADDTLLVSGSINKGSSASFSYAALTAGSYYLQISGIANGTLGGAYSGSISVTPVPEPETFAMLLAGLGVMGAIARRRKI